jgi:hypothetical protein
MSAKQILEKDAQELATTTGLKVQVIEEGGRLFVLIDAYRLPPAVAQIEKTDVLFMTDLQYPFSAMDMFWVNLEVIRPNGSIFENSESVEEYIGRKWRRFSYHRNNIWNPAGNPLLDHFAFMETRWTGKAKR